MAVTVTDGRTTLDQADAATNFNQGTAITTDYAEAIGSVAFAINIGTNQLYWTGTAINFTTAGNELIYIWSSNTASQNSWSAGASSSHAIWLSDGSNDLVIMNAGNDRETFKHYDNQVQFQCFLIDADYLDTKNSNGEIYVAAGSYASFDPAAVTEVGCYYVTLTKALGGGYNTFIDIIRYGTAGLTIYGGTTGDRGTFLEVVSEDRSRLDGKAHGIIREYTGNTYGSQGTLNFGTTSATGDAWFDDSDISLTFEDRDVGDDKFNFVVQGNSTDSNNFYLSRSSINSARPSATVDMSSSNIDVLDLDAVTFNALKNTISFPTDSASFTHSVANCIFNDCGQVDPGTVDFTSNTFTNTNAPLTGAMLIDSDGTTNISGLSFVSGGTGHAIYITATGTYTFTNFSYSGYGSTGTTDAVVYNNSSGLVTIDVSGGTSPTYRNGAGASTDINNSVDLTITCKNQNGLAIQGIRVRIETDPAGTLITEGTTNASGIFTDSYNYLSDTDVKVIARLKGYTFNRASATIIDTGLSIPFTMIRDQAVNLP